MQGESVVVGRDLRARRIIRLRLRAWAGARL